MTERTHVGSEQAKHCEHCERETVHYLYHSGDWICAECGNG